MNYPVCEYMQGDWLLPYRSDIPDRVREISYQEEPAGIWCVLNFVNNRSTFTYPGYCTPIPITPEILEANGFTRYSVVHFNLQQWVLNEGNGCRVSLYQDVKSGKWAIKDFWIDYVHELQHILRLCKIEKEIML